MSTVTKAVLSAAIVAVAASTASAATRHPNHVRATTVEQRLSGAAYRSFGLGELPSGQMRGSGSGAIDYFGDPYNRQERKCFAGSCSPDWRSDY